MTATQLRAQADAAQARAAQAESAAHYAITPIDQSWHRELAASLRLRESQYAKAAAQAARHERSW